PLMRRIDLILSALVIATVMLVVQGCNQKQEHEEPQTSSAPGELKGSVAGIHWSVPARWTDHGERPMRVASYAVPAAAEDAELGAECAVSFFGAGQGGTVELNIQRWIGQFEQPVSPERSSREIGGINVEVLKVTGTYLSPGGPMMQSLGKKEGYRMLGAVVEAPEGMVFFKLTGPERTVQSAEEEFDALIASLSN
ncbi:MAG: hypothetical protein KAJ12_09520, partial [Bacteroidetes bacterium]|nr:hypothetical protein [Bacteroidota bacterium]